MTFVAFTDNLFTFFKKLLNTKSIYLLLIIIGAILFRFYKIGKSFPFDYDQAIPANAAYDLINNGKLSLIGQELSFPGFYLGPLHNWIQFIPYYSCNLSPACVPYFYMLISTGIIILLFYVLRKIFNDTIALIVTFFYSFSFTAVSFERGVNSNYFLFFSQIVLLYSIHKYMQGQNKFLILGGFVAGLATVNFNPIFIFSSILFFLAAFFIKKRNYSYLFIATAAFLVNYLPLLIFNVRHNNILARNLNDFVNTNTGSGNLFERLNFLTFDAAIPFSTNYLFHNTSMPLVIIIVLLFLTSAYFTFTSKRKIYYFLVAWPIITVIGFTQYRGHVPDYYFQQSSLAILILTATVLSKNKFVAAIFLTFYLSINITQAVKTTYPINYQLKNKIAKHIISDANKQPFNVYYQLAHSQNLSYITLFKLYKKEPQENQKNLYIIDALPNNFDQYYSSFQDKNVKVITFNSLIRVISVK